MEWYLGEIRNFAFGRAPTNWAQCNGQLLPISQNQALFAIIGTIYGGDGRTTFALPDLRGRVMVGNNQASADYPMGTKGGAEQVTLTLASTPAHNHTFNARKEAGTLPAIAGNLVSSSGGAAPQALYAQPGNAVPLNAGSLSTFGGGQPHSNLQPYLATNYCIATKGLFPPRS